MSFSTHEIELTMFSARRTWNFSLPVGNLTSSEKAMYVFFFVPVITFLCYNKLR